MRYSRRNIWLHDPPILLQKLCTLICSILAGPRTYKKEDIVSYLLDSNYADFQQKISSERSCRMSPTLGITCYYFLNNMSFPVSLLSSTLDYSCRTYKEGRQGRAYFFSKSTNVEYIEDVIFTFFMVEWFCQTFRRILRHELILLNKNEKFFI